MPRVAGLATGQLRSDRVFLTCLSLDLSPGQAWRKMTVDSCRVLAEPLGVVGPGLLERGGRHGR